MIIGLTNSYLASVFAKQLQALSPSYTDIYPLEKVSLGKKFPSLPYRRLIITGIDSQEAADRIIELHGGIVHFAKDPSREVVIPTPIKGSRHFICDIEEGDHYEADDVVYALRYTKLNK